MSKSDSRKLIDFAEKILVYFEDCSADKELWTVISRDEVELIRSVASRLQTIEHSMNDHEALENMAVERDRLQSKIDAIRDELGNYNEMEERCVKAEAERDEALWECNELSCVFEARFAAAMAGEPSDRLDRGVTSEQIERETNAIVRVIERIGPAFTKLRTRTESAESERDELRGVVKMLKAKVNALENGDHEDLSKTVAQIRNEAFQKAVEICKIVERTPPMTGEDAAMSCARRILGMIDKSRS